MSRTPHSDVGAGGVGELDRETPDATSHAGDQHLRGEPQARISKARSAVIPAVGSVAACASDIASGTGASLLAQTAASCAQAPS